MKKEDITGIAVVNDKGEFAGNLSLKDLKAIRTRAELFKRLHQTTHNFIIRLRDEVYVHKGERPKTKQFVHETDTLFHALEVLVQHNIHRVFILDEQNKPIGVVALRDILLEWLVLYLYYLYYFDFFFFFLLLLLLLLLIFLFLYEIKTLIVPRNP